MLRKLANVSSTILIFLARGRGYANRSISPEGHRYFYRIIPPPHNHEIKSPIIRRGTGFIKSSIIRVAGLYIRGMGLYIVNKKTPRGTSPRGSKQKTT
jgi:hypothetical protein